MTPNHAASLDSSKDPSPDMIGAYRVLGVLGRGGMGVVYDALAPHGERVALKVIRPQGDPEHQSLLTARFMREAKILEQLNHPGVVRLIDAGDVDGILYLAMERIEGVSLLTIRRQGPLGYDPLIQLGVKLSDTLAHMHEAGVIHRDIKPANILIDSAGHPIITDFGISGLHDATGITRLGDLLGSPGFMSPEVTEGSPPSELSDQFALGRLLYELGANGAAKRLPKNAPILEILTASLEIDWHRFPKEPRWGALEAILRRMVADRPEERFPSARAVKSALHTLSGHDLLDTDTLSEHVGALGLKPVKSWDLDLPSTPPDEAALLAQNQIQIDEVLRNLDLPAGERTSDSPNLLFSEKTAVDDRPPEHLRPRTSTDPSVADPSEAALTAPSSPVTSDSDHRPSIAHRSEDPTIPPPPSGPPASAPGVRVIPPPAPPRRVISPVPGAQRPVSGSKPISSPVLQAKESAESSSSPATDIPIVQGTKVQGADPAQAPPRSLQTFNIGFQGSQPPPQSDRPEPAEAQIPRLERQIARLKEQIDKTRLESAKSAKREQEGARLKWIAVAFLSAATGFAGAFALHHDHPGTAPVVLVAPAKGALAQPIASFQGTGIPSAKDIQDAYGMLDSALEHLEKKDIEGAEGLLEQCIAVADLPECHRTLGTILTLTRNPAARTHFEQYLHIAPTAPDAADIRKILEKK